MKKQEIQTKKAPKAIGPYSQAISVNGFIFCSGQIGIDPLTGLLVKGGIEKETKQVLSNLGGVLKAGKMNFGNVIKSEIYLKNIKDFEIVNKIYSEIFTDKIKPARVTVEVSKLPKDALVEISCIAYKK